MSISAAYVHKSDLTEILNEDEIREIITSQSHKREPTPPPAALLLSPPASLLGNPGDGTTGSELIAAAEMRSLRSSHSCRAGCLLDGKGNGSCHAFVKR